MLVVVSSERYTCSMLWARALKRAAWRRRDISRPHCDREAGGSEPARGTTALPRCRPLSWMLTWRTATIWYTLQPVRSLWHVLSLSSGLSCPRTHVYTWWRPVDDAPSLRTIQIISPHRHRIDPQLAHPSLAVSPPNASHRALSLPHIYPPQHMRSDRVPHGPVYSTARPDCPSCRAWPTQPLAAHSCAAVAAARPTALQHTLPRPDGV